MCPCFLFFFSFLIFHFQTVSGKIWPNNSLASRPLWLAPPPPPKTLDPPLLPLDFTIVLFHEEHYMSHILIFLFSQQHTRYNNCIFLCYVENCYLCLFPIFTHFFCKSTNEETPLGKYLFMSRSNCHIFCLYSCLHIPPSVQENMNFY